MIFIPTGLGQYDFRTPASWIRIYEILLRGVALLYLSHLREIEKIIGIRGVPAEALHFSGVLGEVVILVLRG